MKAPTKFPRFKRLSRFPWLQASRSSSKTHYPQGSQAKASKGCQARPQAIPGKDPQAFPNEGSYKVPKVPKIVWYRFWQGLPPKVFKVPMVTGQPAQLQSPFPEGSQAKVYKSSLSSKGCQVKVPKRRFPSRGIQVKWRFLWGQVESPTVPIKFPSRELSYVT